MGALASSTPLMLMRPANGQARNVARRKYFVPSLGFASGAGRGRVACSGTLVEVTGSSDGAGAVGGCGDIPAGGFSGSSDLSVLDVVIQYRVSKNFPGHAMARTRPVAIPLQVEAL